jgi:hypothetical protein
MIFFQGNSSQKVDVFPCFPQVLEFLRRKSDFFKSPSVAIDMVTTIARRYAESGDVAADANKLSLGGAAGAPAAAARSAGALRTLPLVVSASAKTALEKARKDREAALAEDAAGGGTPGGIKPGTQCKLNGCAMVYRDESSLREQCLHHPGVPVFHEGAPVPTRAPTARLCTHRLLECSSRWRLSACTGGAGRELQGTNTGRAAPRRRRRTSLSSSPSRAVPAAPASSRYVH